MAEYDLTPRMAPNLDRHLVFPLLEFLQERQLYDDNHILKAKIDLLNNTNMVDYAMDIHKTLYHTEDVPQDMVERRADVVARLKSLEDAAAPLVAFLQNPAAVQELRADKLYNLQMLNDKYQVSFNRFITLFYYINVIMIVYFEEIIDFRSN
jgi:translation initiation factor 3 subunit E